MVTFYALCSSLLLFYSFFWVGTSFGSSILGLKRRITRPLSASYGHSCGEDDFGCAACDSLRVWTAISSTCFHQQEFTKIHRTSQLYNFNYYGWSSCLTLCEEDEKPVLSLWASSVYGAFKLKMLNGLNSKHVAKPM